MANNYQKGGGIETVDNEKDLNIKGVNTVTGKDPFIEKLNEDIPPALEYKEPTTPEEYYSKLRGTQATQSGRSDIQGFKGVMDAEAFHGAYASVDLARGIPDWRERQAFIKRHGQHLVPLVSPNTYGVRFEKDLLDLAKYKERAYPYAVKSFIDDLDENQGFMEEMMLNATKQIGLLTVDTIGNLIGGIYGGISALASWDSNKMYDNGFYEVTDLLKEGIEGNTVVYGGSNIWDFKPDPETGIMKFEQKDFLVRFINDPIKSYNADLAPAISFVGGIVMSELIYGAVTAATFGAAAPTLAIPIANATRYVGKSMRLLRGLDKVDDLTKAAQVATLAEKYRRGFGYASAAYRSSAYESALIGRSTKDRTLDNLLRLHHEKVGGTIGPDGQIYDAQGNPIDELIAPTDAEFSGYRRTSEDAGFTAYFMNIPIVATSNFVQFPKLFSKNWRLARTASNSKIFNKIKWSGTRMQNGKRMANVDASGYVAALGYTRAILARPIIEGWEEFAQGAMEEGLIDYYAATHTRKSSRTFAGMMNAISKEAAVYLDTVEGRDSVTIGAIMGLLGFRAPVRVDPHTGKMGFSLRGTAYGGSFQAYRDTKKKIKQARLDAEYLKNQNFNPILKANFENAIRHRNFQEDMDAAAVANDIYTYKNKEGDTLFSLLYNREKLGLGAATAQDIEAMRQMPLNIFNETYGTKNIEEFTEESRTYALNKAEADINRTLKAIDEVNTLVRNKGTLNKYYKYLSTEEDIPLPETLIHDSKGDPLGIVEQLAYLHATVLSSKAREEKLSEEIRERTGKSFDTAQLGYTQFDSLDEIAAEVVKANAKTQRVVFRDQAQEVKKAILQQWKEDDFNNYNLEKENVIPLLDDLIKLKIRRAEASALYAGMFTPKGAKNFLTFALGLKMAQEAAIAEENEKLVEEELEKSKNAGIAKVAKNEESVTGNTKFSDEVIDKQTHEGILEYDKIIEDETLSEEDREEAIINILDKYPGFLALVKHRLAVPESEEEAPILLDGVKTAQELFNRDTEGNIVGPLYQKLKELSEEARKRRDAQPDELFDDVEDSEQHVPTDEEVQKKLEESSKKIVDEETESRYPKGKRTSKHGFQTPTHDRQIEDGENVIDKTGKPAPHAATGHSSNPLDANRINAPEFLDNEELANTPHYVEFHVQTEEENPHITKLREEGNLNAANYPISVIYVDPNTKEIIFITKLMEFREGKDDEHVLKLREEVLARNEQMAETKETEPQNVERRSEIKEEKEKIKEEIKEEKDIKKKIEDLEEEKSTLESQIESETKEEAPTDIEAKKAKIKRREKQYKDTQEKVDRKYQEENWTEEEKEWNKTAGEQVIEGDEIDLGIKVDKRTDKSKEGVRVITNVVKKGTSKTRQKVDVTQFDSQEAADQWVKEKAESILALHQKHLSKIESETKEEASEVDFNDIKNWKENNDGTFNVGTYKFAPNDLTNAPKDSIYVDSMDTSEFKWQLTKNELVNGELTYAGELLAALKSQSTQQEPTVSKEELESQKTELNEKLSEIETEIKELEGILAKEETKKEKEAAKEAKRKLKEKAKKEKAKKELEKKIDEVIETEIEEDDISTIAKEEEVTEEEVKKIVRESVLDHIKKFGNKVIKAPKTRLKKIINKIIKGIMAMIIGGTFIISASAFSYNNDGQVTFSLENAVENLLPDEQAEWAKRYLDKKGLIDVAEEQIVAEEHVPIIKETPKPEKIFELIGTVPDSYRPTDSIMSYRSQWNNADGFRYIPAPVRKDLPKGGLKVSGVVGVGHFLLDASVAPGKEYSHEYNEPYLRKAKKNNDWVPAFTTNKDSSVTIRYKRANDLTKSDLVVSPLRQMPFQDINFDVTKKPEGFKASIKEVVRKDGTGTYLIFKTRDGYSRFSGGSVVFIFKDKHGNTVIRDFAGSINQIQKEGNSIIEQYNLKEGELTLGYHDVGSFSAKPKAKKGTLSSDQWAGFNPEGWTGGALMIPTEGNIEPVVPTEKEGDIGLLGLALLGNLAAVRRKRKEGKAITEEDIQSLRDAKEEVLNKIKELEAVVPIEKPIVEPKKESIVDKKTAIELKKINSDISKLQKELKVAQKRDIKSLNTKLKELNDELKELNKSFETLTIDINLEGEDIFGRINEVASIKTKKKKAEKAAELEKEFGEENIERAKIIDKNFNNIVEQIINSGINVFFSEQEDGENVHKEC